MTAPARSAYDVAVVGAGPAGLAVSLACATRGKSVLVVDRRVNPIDKACGEGLMPDAVEILDRLGVELPGHHPIPGIRYVNGATTAQGRFPSAPAAGVRRTALQTAMLERARALGVELVQPRRVECALDRDPPADGGGRPPGAGARWHLEAGDFTVTSRWVAAADGLHSPIRRRVRLDREPRRRDAKRFGIRRHFRIEPWTEMVEVHWGPGAEAYVTPVAENEIGIAILWTARSGTDGHSRADNADDDLPGGSDPPGVFERRLDDFPELQRRVATAEAVSSARAAGPLRQRTRGVVSGNLALVGDASGYVDAITGEGMALAFHHAESFADAVVAGDLAGYERDHRRLGRMPGMTTELTLQLSAHQWLRNRAIGALAAEPDLFDRILAVHARAAQPHALLSRPLLRGACRLVRAPRAFPETSPAHRGDQARPAPFASWSKAPRREH